MYGSGYLTLGSAHQMTGERSSGKAHHKATKFFDFTAPPFEKNRRILHKQLRRGGLQAGGEGWVSDPSDLSDLSDIALPPLAGGGRGAILLPVIVVTNTGISRH